MSLVYFNTGDIEGREVIALTSRYENDELEDNIEDRAALRCRSDPRRTGWEKGVPLGGSVVTKRLYIIRG